MASNHTLANHKVQLLLFTDDVVLLADSIKELQELIDRLAEYCKTWKLNINVDKTKVVIFNRKQYVHQVLLILDNMKLEFVPSYKYLRFILSSNGSFKPAISILAKQASKALLFSLFHAISKLAPDSSLIGYLYLMHLWGLFWNMAMKYGVATLPKNLKSYTDASASLSWECPDQLLI